ncbi:MULTISPECIES: sensor histidine kinase [unclassified Allomuricauda]|uniref:sensor histidine kinase n=1 Tax=unclassified Allomuricauda TaxID=2615049 RepID=UPI00273FC9EE|nr:MULTISPECIES: sensor histidine kinase [unclassified Allomuricauda]
MDQFDFRYLTTVVFTSIFGVFGIYHLLSFVVLKHRLLLYYFILILGLTLHWSLYFFLNGAFGGEFAVLADKASLTTAMITTSGLLLFTKSYLNITADNHPLLSKIYKVTQQIVVGLPVLHITNHLTAQIGWLNDFLVLMAAFMAMYAILLNIFSGIRLFRSHELNRYYLYSYTPILMAALLYIGTWFAKRYYDFDVNPILLTTSILVTFQLILFSLIIGFKYKAIEEQHMQMQVNANKRLEAEVAKQTADLQMAKKALEDQNEELEKINQLKNKLFSLLSHDVRAPLNNVVTIIELIQQDIEDSELKPITENLKNEISDKVSMVNDLLKWSYQQLDGVGMDKEECDLNKVLESIKDEFSRMAQDKNITIEMEVSQPTLVIDPTMLQVVLRNLTSNAIKFSDNGQKVVLWSQKQGEHIELGVKDFGMGMEKDWYQRLQNDKRPEIRKGTKGEKGTGFGLVIAKDFVEMNGGQLICESEMGKGTNFILRFPADSENTKSQTKTSNSPVHSL